MRNQNADLITRATANAERFYFGLLPGMLIGFVISLVSDLLVG